MIPCRVLAKHPELPGDLPVPGKAVSLRFSARNIAGCCRIARSPVPDENGLKSQTTYEKLTLDLILEGVKIQGRNGQPMSTYAISFDIAAIFVCIACFASVLLRHQTGKLQNKVFLLLLVIITCGATTNTILTLSQPLTQENILMGNAAQYIYFILHTALPPAFFYYMLCVAGAVRRYSKKMHLIFILPALICELLVLSNPITGWTYTFDESFAYYRGWVVYLIYGVAAAYLFAGVFLVLKTWNALTPIRRNSLLFYVGLVLSGIFVQMVVPPVRIELFAESVAMMGMLLTIENEDDRRDNATGVYLRSTLLVNFERYLSSGVPVNVVCLRMENLDFVARALGPKSSTLLLGEVSSWLKGFIPWFRIYRASLSSFIIVSFDPEPDEVEEWSRKIEERFKSPWNVLDADVPISAVVMYGGAPADFASGEEVLMMADTPVPSGLPDRVLSGSDLAYLKRRTQVEQAVVRGFEDGNFEVYYQPICRADGTVCAAEALMRLADPIMGNIPPDEFIEVAEHNGTIDRIGMFALEEVCRFIATGEPARVGVDLIHVNLSVVQCLDPDFSESAEAVLEGHGVSPAQVNFEITESFATDDETALRKTLNKLVSDGFHFSMDDYGTGYSNMHHIFAYDFDVVKVDKSILWDADRDGDALTVLEYTMKMIHKTGRKTVVEGVETPTHVELLRRLGADYFQGFYYSRPLPRDAFISRVEELQEEAKRQLPPSAPDNGELKDSLRISAPAVL